MGAETRAPIQILALVDRALGPALKRFGLNPLIERRISDVLDPAARKSLTDFFDNPLNGSPGGSSCCWGWKAKQQTARLTR